MEARSSAVRRSYLCGAIGASMCLCLPGLAAASPVSVSIDDLTETLGVTLSGGYSNLSSQITQEGIGQLGVADLHFEFLSVDPNVLANGAISAFNYNIVEAPSVLSDTLNITLTGHTGTPADPNNVSVDMHFRSDSLDGIAPDILVNAVTLAETGNYQIVNSGLSDLTVQFRSDVSEIPLPAALPLFASGIGGAMGLLGWRRKKKAAALAA